MTKREGKAAIIARNGLLERDEDVLSPLAERFEHVPSTFPTL